MNFWIAPSRKYLEETAIRKDTGEMIDLILVHVHYKTELNHKFIKDMN